MALDSTLVFQCMFNSRFGLFNQFLEAIRLESKLWFIYLNLAIIVIIVFIICSEFR